MQLDRHFLQIKIKRDFLVRLAFAQAAQHFGFPLGQVGNGFLFRLLQETASYHKWILNAEHVQPAQSLDEATDVVSMDFRVDILPLLYARTFPVALLRHFYQQRDGQMAVATLSSIDYSYQN